MQSEVSALSPRVAFLDHQRLILNVDNSALKQRIAALAQDKIFKDGKQLQPSTFIKISRFIRIVHERTQQNNITAYRSNGMRLSSSYSMFKHFCFWPETYINTSINPFTV